LREAGRARRTGSSVVPSWARRIAWGAGCLLLACQPSPPPLDRAGLDLAPDPSAETGPAGESRILYRVVPGDTLWRISRWYGVAPAELAVLNQIEDARIRAGQLLQIPGSALRTDPPPPRPSTEAVASESQPGPTVKALRGDPLPAQQGLEQAERLLENADFDAAWREIVKLRDQIDPDRERDQPLAIRLEELTAHLHMARGEEDLAQAAFERALELDKQYRPAAHTPPKVRRVFEAALEPAAR
jgi:tetratricopeptide (TPR) repeat protein